MMSGYLMCTLSSMVSHSHLRVCEGRRVGEFKCVCARSVFFILGISLSLFLCLRMFVLLISLLS